jgi:flavin reductase (DIM6/NTAB) family NADH-FMN oxidoreductase RutF
MIAPIPVTLVTCVDKEGRPNIITISLICKMWGEPCDRSERPLFMIAVHPARYSHRLIEDTGEFVVNLPTTDLVQQVEYCGTRSGRKFDKFRETKLTPLPAKFVKAPLIEECVINIECRVDHKLTVVRGTYTLFFGEAVAVHVNEGLWDGLRLDLDKAPLISDFFLTEYRAPGQVILRRGGIVSSRP